jgi:hypothetical protein
MEDDLNFFQMEEDLNFLIYGRRPQFFQIEEDLKILVNGRQTQKTINLKQLRENNGCGTTPGNLVLCSFV